jgi:hypothetical protein
MSGPTADWKEEVSRGIQDWGKRILIPLSCSPILPGKPKTKDERKSAIHIWRQCCSSKFSWCVNEMSGKIIINCLKRLCLELGVYGYNVDVTQRLSEQ